MRCGFVEESTALSEGVCHRGKRSFEVSYVWILLSELVDFLLSAKCSLLSSSTKTAYMLPYLLS